MPKARKNYNCDLCELPINKGSDYFYQRVTPWDNPDNDCFGDFRAHRYCYSVWCKLNWDGCDVDSFREELGSGVVLDYEELKVIVNQSVADLACAGEAVGGLRGYDGLL